MYIGGRWVGGGFNARRSERAQHSTASAIVAGLLLEGLESAVGVC